MSTMDIKDVCDADHAERSKHYHDQMCPPNADFAEAVYHSKEARQLATQEMTNEIHCMLLHLTKDARE